MNALIFDCDGVLADTERDGHRPAFNQTFHEFGLPVEWSVEEYGRLLKIAGGKERMASMLTPEFVKKYHLPEDPQEQKEMLAQWHKRKGAIFQEILASGQIAPRPGVKRLAQEAFNAGWKLAVASTSAEPSVRATLKSVVGEELAQAFTVLAGDVVPHKKPAPDVYLLTLERLSLTPDEAIIIEDSRNGLVAAVTAGVRCLVTISSYTAEEDMSEALLVVTHLGDPGNPMRVVANRSAAKPGEMIMLKDLQACLATPVKMPQTETPASHSGSKAVNPAGSGEK